MKQHGKRQPDRLTSPALTSGREERNKAGTREAMDFRLEPDKRMCPQFDATSIALYPVADREEMGVRVVDNCAEEHRM